MEKLPDGSTVVFDNASGTVHSLNSSAAAAFEACRDSCTVASVARGMSERLDAAVTEDVAWAAISELEAAGLVVCSGSREAAGRGASRRSMLQKLAAVSAVGLPVVLSLGAAEQKAFAGGVGSGTTTTTTTTTSAPASIPTISPNSVCTSAQDQLIFTVTGLNTHFNQATTVVTLTGPNSLVVGTVTVNSATSLTVAISGILAIGNSYGDFIVRVGTGNEHVSAPAVNFGQGALFCST